MLYSSDHAELGDLKMRLLGWEAKDVGNQRKPPNTKGGYARESRIYFGRKMTFRGHLSYKLDAVAL